MPRIPAEVLTAALQGLEVQKARIDDQIASLRTQLGRRGPGRRPSSKESPPTAPAPGVQKRRKLSVAARKRIAAAQKKRWAEFRKKQSA